MLLAKKVELPAVKEKFAHRIGRITAISQSSITIEDREGKVHTGVLTPQTKKLPTGASFAVGDRVLAMARWDDDAGADGACIVLLLVKLGGASGPGTPGPSTTATPSSTGSPTATSTSPAATPSPAATQTSPTATPTARP